ncbi:MAG: 2-amino-4-hydroxy-6-hydroxymethyldihydropteridine diphosphokinase [Odoribacteraceae bacterium]|jgi:2-amino-4-hydroxy-6-hydroxymethyldihydropteridine diphosphokinase|nr:2-amino-4-hydroxy-6-hydroxymethyldihydropteridine diphosphokinase [Odoribacteraceae bacterium]
MEGKDHSTRNRTPELALSALIFGSNRGDREGNINRAIALVNAIGREERRSALYESDPWGFDDHIPFYNQVVLYRTALAPRDVLKTCMETEQRLGRQRDASARYAPRPIDVDILFHGALVIDHPDLVIPHPRLPDRRFVLVPLGEILPDFIHPTLGKPISTLLEECADHGNVRLAGIS